MSLIDDKHLLCLCIYLSFIFTEGLQVVQLEDGTTAYISSTLNLDACTGSGGGGSNEPSPVNHSEESTEVDKMILTRVMINTI